MRPSEGRPLTVMMGITAYAGGVGCDKPVYPFLLYADGTLRMIVRPVFGTTPELTLPAGSTAIKASAFEGAARTTAVDVNSCGK